MISLYIPVYVCACTYLMLTASKIHSLQFLKSLTQDGKNQGTALPNLYFCNRSKIILS